MNIAEHKLLVALGGVNEIGKNMYFIQYDQDIVVIDCGSNSQTKTCRHRFNCA